MGFCNHAHPVTAQHCTHCGSNLTQQCSHCTEILPLRAKFCSGCGLSLQGLETNQPPASVHSAGPGERRPATILFSDLTGYTALNETMDPEEVESIMRRIKERAVEIVERHGGIVNQFVGDEVLALFGVLQAHEDDPVSAVQSAIELHEYVRAVSPEVEARIGRFLRMHTGIHTGLILANPRDSRDGLYGITGETVITGVRLKCEAEPDEILVSGETRKLIDPYVQTEQRPPVTLKGQVRPLIAYHVVSPTPVQTRFDISALRGFSRYCGRNKELDVLEARLEGVTRGRGSFVAISGDPGVGKSRLVYEVTAGLQTDRIQLIKGKCQRVAQATPFAPFLEAMRNALGLTDDVASEMQGEQVREKINALGAFLSEYTSYYLHLLGIQTETWLTRIPGDELRHLLIDALSQFCIGLASRRPTVLILEDWHWRDEASEQVLRRLAEMVADRPLAIVATARPEYDFSWASSIEPSQLIVLSPLDFHDSEAIMRSVLKADALPAGLSACIFEQTIGNPLFLEEICHAFLEEGVVVVEQRTAFLTRPVMELLLPESVQSIIRSRLDRLDWHVKEVLRVASVIGRVFTVHLLERVCEGQGASRLRESLDTLTRFDMLLPVEGHQRTEYMFKHVLTQEVTYSTVLLQRRKALHGVVGQAIEDLYHHRIHEVVDLLLHHYSLAEDWAKAAHYARESAERARRLSRFEEALEFLERRKFAISKLVIGRDAHGMLVETLLEEERLCDTLGWRARQEAVIEQLFSVLQYYREPTAVTAALLRQGDLQTQLGQYGKADAALTECLAMRGAMNDRSGESHALRSRSFLRWHQAKLEEAVADNEAAFRIDEARGDYRAMSHDLTNLAPVLQQLGDFDGALKRLEHALALEARERDPFNRMTILFNIANLHNKAGDFSTALAYYRDSLAVCVEHHLRINQTLVLNCMASIYWKEGRSADCLALYEEAVAICRDMKYGRGLSNVLMAIGNVFLLLDRAAEALPYFLECTTLLAELGDKVTEALSWNMAAHIYEQTGQHRQAFEAWKHARSLRAERMDQRGELDAVEAMGKLARDCFHEPMQALRLFQEGLDLAISLQDFRKEGDLFNAMAVAHWGQGVFDEALRHYEAARDRYSQAGALPEMTLMVNSVGMTLHKLRRDEEAMTQLEEALALAQKAEHRLFEGYALASLGDVCLDRRDMRQARLFYERSYEIRRQIGDRRGEGWMLHQLGLTESIDGNHDAARERIEEALSIAKAGHDTELVDTCTRAFEALVD